MGKITESAEEDVTSSPSSLGEALLFATVCIVGLPVEVHVKDGSVYSGIFHTASVVDKGYGVALKKARMIRKGTCNANEPNEDLIETLVVLPEDLVQVVAKGIMLSSSAAPSAASRGNEEAVCRPINCSQSSENGAVISKHEREVAVSRPQEEEDGHCPYPESVKEASEIDGSSPSLNGHYTELDVQKEHNATIVCKQLANENPAATANYTSPDIKLVNQFHETNIPKEFMRTEAVTSGVSYSVKPEAVAAHGGLAVAAEIAPQNSVINRTAKESKLNPGAKVFSPSFSSLRSTPPLVPAAPSMAYVPNNIPSVQAQPEAGVRPIAPRSSWPIKVFPYVNSTPTNTDSGLQYTQQIAGHITARPQSIRNGAQYQSIQAAPPYIHPNPQSAMIGRPGQVVYVHSIPHDMVQGPAALSQAPHPFMASHPIHVAKHEGVLAGQALPVSVTPPLVTHMPQQFAMPNHIQLSQPLFSSMIPLPVLSSNVPYASKFP